MNKGIARLIFIVVFLIPVAWYLILQLFGDNKFSLTPIGSLNDCVESAEVQIIRSSDAVSIAEKNYLDRVLYYANKRSIEVLQKDDFFFQCVNQSDADLVLINEAGVWGAYALSREGVDLLITELDILILQQTYGEGAER